MYVREDTRVLGDVPALPRLPLSGTHSSAPSHERQRSGCSSARDEGMTRLIAHHPEVARVPRPLLERVMQVFGSLHDRRSINGCQFLACFLRLAQVKQLALVPDQAPHDVAVITIPGLRALCTRPVYSWPYCYETTAKYFAILCAAGVFLKPKQKRGMGTCYYFPLTCAVGLPMSSTLVQQLGKRRRKVRCSQALQRVAQMAQEQEQEGNGKRGRKICQPTAQFHPSSPQYARSSLPLSGPSIQETPVDSQSRKQGAGGSVSHEARGKERGDPEWRQIIIEAVEDVAQMMQSVGLVLPPPLKAHLQERLIERLGSTDLPRQQSPSPQKQQLVSTEPAMEHKKESHTPLSSPQQTTSHPSHRRQSTLPTGFSSLKDLLAGGKAMRGRRDDQQASNETKDLPSIQRSTISTPIADSSQQPTISTKVVDLSRTSTIPTEMVDPSQKSTIPTEMVDPPQESIIPSEMVDFSHQWPQNDSQRAYTHAPARVEFTHSLTSLDVLTSENSEIRESEKEKTRASVVQKQVIHGMKQVPSKQAVSQQVQREMLAYSSTSALKQEVNHQGMNDRVGGREVQMEHRLASETCQEDRSARLASPLSPMRQHLAEIRTILQALPPALMRDLALDCSQRFSQSNEKAGVYLKRLYEHPEMLHLAAVDALVRTWFPDPGRQPNRLKGGWVINRYRAYVEQGEEPPEDIFAWARWVIEYGFNYEVLEMVLEVAASQRSAEERGYVRPLPHQLVLDGMRLNGKRRRAFWVKGGASEMERQGVLFVDLDGALYTPQEYEQHRQQILEDVLTGYPREGESVTEEEVQAYLTWLQARDVPQDENQASLSLLSPALQQLAHQMAEQIDPRQYLLRACLHPTSQRSVIEVVERGNESNAWLLWTQDHVSLWLEWYQSQGEQEAAKRAIDDRDRIFL